MKKMKMVDIEFVCAGGQGAGGWGGSEVFIDFVNGSINITIPANGDLAIFNLMGLKLYLKYDKECRRVVYCNEEGDPLHNHSHCIPLHLPPTLLPTWNE